MEVIDRVKRGLLTITRGQYEVLRRILDERTYPSIAAEMDLSKRTIEMHYSDVLKNCKCDRPQLFAAARLFYTDPELAAYLTQLPAKRKPGPPPRTKWGRSPVWIAVLPLRGPSS